MPNSGASSFSSSSNASAMPNLGGGAVQALINAMSQTSGLMNTQTQTAGQFPSLGTYNPGPNQQVPSLSAMQQASIGGGYGANQIRPASSQSGTGIGTGLLGNLGIGTGQGGIGSSLLNGLGSDVAGWLGAGGAAAGATTAGAALAAGSTDAAVGGAAAAGGVADFLPFLLALL